MSILLHFQLRDGGEAAAHGALRHGFPARCRKRTRCGGDGRAAFVWPLQAETALSENERAEWKRLHGVIRRATDEKVANRFVDFKAMGAAHAGTIPKDPTQPGKR